MRYGKINAEGYLSVTGSLNASTGMSGSLTQLLDGTSYLIAGTNVTITSQSNGSVVIASTGGGGTPASPNEGVQFNAGGSFGASSNFTYDSTQQRLYVSGTVSMGFGSVAEGYLSHAEGLHTIASGAFQHVGGKYNKRGNDFSLFVIGDGTGDSNVDRSDILRVNSGSVGGNGSVQVTGSLQLTGVFEKQAYITNTKVKLFTSPTGYSTNYFCDVDQVGERLEFPNVNHNFITVTGPKGTFGGSNGGKLHIRAGSATGEVGTGGDLYLDPGGSGSLGGSPGLILFGTKNGASLIGFSGGTSSAPAGSDAFFVVSGSVAGSGVDDRRAVFCGDVVTSGSYLLNVRPSTPGSEPIIVSVSSSDHLTVFTNGNVTASLPVAAHVGTQLIFKDGTGAASTSPQMLSCSLGTIDGSATYTLPFVNYAAVTIAKVQQPDVWVVI